jgi:hypothetical protein
MKGARKKVSGTFFGNLQNMGRFRVFQEKVPDTFFRRQ